MSRDKGRSVRLKALLFAFGVAACGSSSVAPSGEARDAGGSRSDGSSETSGGDGSVVDSTSSSPSRDGDSLEETSTGVSPEASGDASRGDDSSLSNPSRDGGDGDGGDGDGGDGGAGADGDIPSSNFSCNLLIGESPTGQWFDSGFLRAVDPTRWECIWIAHHYTNLWASPTDPGWRTAFDPYPGPPHTCASGSTTPDRVIFVAAQWSETTAAEWETDLSAIVQNIEAMYAGVKRIELMALTGAPSGMSCPFAGPGTNETVIPPIGYDAIAAMPAKFPGLVFALPHFDVPQCSDFVVTGGQTMPQYTDAGAIDVAANVFGPYYATHP